MKERPIGAHPVTPLPRRILSRILLAWGEPRRSTVAWSCGGPAFMRARLVCAVLGHHWAPIAAIYGEYTGPYRTDTMLPWDTECSRCGLTRGVNP